MFYIRGGDGKQYGPASTEQVQAWFAEHRLDPQSLVQREGETEWQPLAQIPELSHLTNQSAGSSALPGFNATTEDALRDKALRRVSGPAWGMMVSGILGVLWCLFQLVATIVRGPAENPVARLLGQEQTEAQAMGFMAGMIASLAFGLIWAGLVAFAGSQLRTLRAKPLVIAASILMMIPCFGTSLPVCLLSLPIGIWALVTVNSADVRSAFR